MHEIAMEALYALHGYLHPRSFTLSATPLADHVGLDWQEPSDDGALSEAAIDSICQTLAKHVAEKGWTMFAELDLPTGVECAQRMTDRRGGLSLRVIKAWRQYPPPGEAHWVFRFDVCGAP